jgi:hypothetical protein
MPSSSQIDANAFSDDILEFIRLLEKYKVHYLIVGGEAVIFHGYPRLTGDVDFFYERTEANTHTWQFWIEDPNGLPVEFQQYTPESAQRTGLPVEINW